MNPYDQHPMLNDASLTALILRTAETRPAQIRTLMDRLAALEEKAGEALPASRSGLEAHIAALIRALAAAGLVDGASRLTETGASLLAEHPNGFDLSDLPALTGEPPRPGPRHRGGAEDPHPDAYRAGVAARLAGQNVTENPHPADTADHGAWEDGWSEAEPE